MGSSDGHRSWLQIREKTRSVESKLRHIGPNYLDAKNTKSRQNNKNWVSFFANTQAFDHHSRRKILGETQKCEIYTQKMTSLRLLQVRIS